MDLNIIMPALLAALAGLTFAGALRFRRSGDREWFWRWLVGLSLPLAVAAGLVLWWGLPEYAADSTGPRGFGPDWRCSPRWDFCYRETWR